MNRRYVLPTATLLVFVLSAQAQTVFNPEWPRVGPFSAAEMCSSCHDASALNEEPAILRAPDATSPDLPSPTSHNISPFFGQKNNVMGHALDDPYFVAAVDDEVSRFPDQAGAIEDTCLRCHAPMGSDYAHQFPSGVLDQDDYYRLDTAVFEMQAREGVSCTLCHQIQLQPDAELANGSWFVGDESVLFGPIIDPFRTRMARYGVEFSDAISDSALCGSCHNVYTPVLDPDTGEATDGRFLEQAAWFEWRNSSFAQGTVTNCQDCHMATPTKNFQTPVATYNLPPARPDYSTHMTPGGNTQLLQTLSDYRIQLGLDPRLTNADFELAIETTREFLKQAATLSLATDGLANLLMVDATIENLTGHKLPTGYPSRRMWLHLKVSDALGATVFESGAPDASGRLTSDASETAASCLSLAKLPGFDNTPCYTPHHDVIDNAADTAVFEPVLADVNNNITYVLLAANSYLKDNRIPPAGFTTTSDDFLPEMASVGTQADMDFNASGSGQDTVHYRIQVSPANGPFAIEATLYYQSIRPAFVAVLEADTTRVNNYLSYYEAVPPRPEILAAAVTSAVVDIVFIDGFEFVP